MVPDWLRSRASLSPNRLALDADGRRLTFAELDGHATAMARRLSAAGAGAGSRVAVLVRDPVAMSALVHGAGRAGIVIVLLNVRLASSEIAWQITDSRAQLVVFETRTASLVPARLLERVGDESAEPVRAVDLQALRELPDSAAAVRERISLSDVHTIVYTSGTTGRPKGAMLTHGNFWWSAMGSALNLGLRNDDRWLSPLPLYHVGGLSILMRGVIYGIPAVVHSAFDPHRVNRAIDEDGVTIVSVVASMLSRMLDERGVRPYPPSLRHILLGGGPAPLPLLKRCAELGLPVVQTYGLTEAASQVATLAPAETLRKIGSAGKPLLPLELRIVRDGRVVPDGEDGEIVVRGPMVTPGYADRPEETARVIRDGWLHTGDIGRLDADGFLYVLDRRDDLIVSGGENVYPAEIEAMLLAHPAVLDAGVTSRANARWGRVPVAFVVVRPGFAAAPDELIAFCRERLARYKVPAEVHIVEALPRNAAGKLLRRQL